MKGPCPKCSSSDAYHTYDYGKPSEHGHCFSCNYHKHSEALEQMRRHLDLFYGPDAPQGKDSRVIHKSGEMSSLTLPPGCGTTIDAKALQWLDKYGIIREEIVKYEIKWDKVRGALVFPIKIKDELKGYQVRSFEDGGMGEPDKERPKWWTRGSTGAIMYAIGPEPKEKGKGTIVLVEDMVSAIKVARQVRTMPLFGAHLNPGRLMWLYNECELVVFWLDGDKWADAQRFSKSCGLVGLKTKIIHSERDPKAHSDEEIYNMVMV